jgi:DNA-binding MarR family transcriptional regulator
VAIGLQKIGLALKHQTWQKANDDALSPTQGQIVALLASQSLTGSEVASALGVTLPTVSDSARVLVEKGLVRKAPDPRHPRASLLSLTAAGKKRVPRVTAWPEFLASAASSMSAEEQAAFLTGLVKMTRTLQANGEIPPNRMCVSCRYFRPNVHEGGRPHHCAFVDAPMAPQHLRLDCADQEAASEAEQEETWRRFVG